MGRISIAAIVTYFTVGFSGAFYAAGVGVLGRQGCERSMATGNTTRDRCR
jgi:hypothetical protein